jgi:hypothetical protein
MTFSQGDIGKVDKEFHLEISSRRRENKGSHKWASSYWNRNNRVTPNGFFLTVFECMYVGFNGEMSIYVGFHKERHVHLGKCESTRSYSGARDC